MRATTLHAPGDIRVTDVPDPRIEEPTDAVVKVVAGCICGSDLWPYRGEDEFVDVRTMGHECIGEVVEVGAEVRDVAVGDAVIVPFCHSDNTCAHCAAGFHSVCLNGGFTTSGQGEYARVTQADGSLVKVDGGFTADTLASMLTLTDVLPTGWHAAVSAGVRPGHTVVVVGDGAVGLCGILSAVAMDAEKVVAMSRHEPRQEVARAFGATHVVAERGREATERVMEITDGIGADAVLECVGAQGAMTTALHTARPGATVGFVGVPHGIQLPVNRMFGTNVGVRGGMAPVRAYLPHLLGRVQRGEINPGLVFDLTLPLDRVADGYRAMDERRAIKVLLQP